MSSASKILYEKLLLDHAKNPRNFGVPDDYDKKLEGFNPLCGDHYTFYLKLDGDVIREIYFTGQGCAISKASASLLTTFLEKQPVNEAVSIIRDFLELLRSSPQTPVDETKWGKLVAITGVREFPIRIKCASLSWHSILALLEGEETKPVSTE
ncbi:MAG TPA: SUF system NifU family Fe-S cluster assembly protein [Candidatus Hydrogenedens sp.]|nr:SUF system NifU family Fe-S cluster assembly protein [Candidatus Hydrogenedens sp.]HOK09848.1 SUF system NifU family Fe-S cluster assembly protein [Candidatus Hydrogenedens sp.]HOL19537.1 SUF system NifU family Fe-S cluster assembly protein [Candidatus Hydrogenedens sp.]HPP59360.1 SUF system NifU family Fe-S cluster assembly protein [Candidatus Hydrogenedens sp.]